MKAIVVMQLSQLKLLWISNNALEDVIPPELCALTDLTVRWQSRASALF